MLASSSYLVLGVGTEVGKTYLVENLCKLNNQISAIKPVITGFVDDNNSDSAKILLSQNIEVNSKNLDNISPWRFEKPVSANFISDISFLELLEFCKNKLAIAQRQNKILLIEGAGGVMSPIGKNYNFLDIASKLNIPILLVTNNYLGSISHTLCSVESIKSRGLILETIIVNEFKNPPFEKPLFEKPITDDEFINCLKDFTMHFNINHKDCDVASLKDFIKIS